MRNWSIWQSPPVRERIESRSAQIRPSARRVDVEAAIEIERRAAPLEPGADPAAVAEDEIDAVLAERGGADDPAGGDAARAARSPASWISAGRGAAARGLAPAGTRMMICWRTAIEPRLRRRAARLLLVAAPPKANSSRGGGARQDHADSSIAAPHSMAALEHAINLLLPRPLIISRRDGLPLPGAARQARRACSARRASPAIAADLAPWLTDWRGRYHGAAAAMLSPASARGGRRRSSRLCAEAGVPLVPQGGNTSMVGGATPDASGAALIVSTRRMNRIRSLDPAAGVAVCEAGVILADLQAAALAAGRRFPLTLGAKGSATVGGLVSTNAGGTQVLRFGPMRRSARIEACSTALRGLARSEGHRGYD